MIESVAFAGLGAVGAIYAQPACLLSQVPCYAIVRNKQSYLDHPVSVNGERLKMEMINPEEAEKPASLVIVAVKWHTFPEVLEQIAPVVGEGTIILSLLNGISSEQVIRSRFPQARVLLAMCSGVDSNRQGRAVCMNRRGRIVFGETDGRISEAVADVAAYFDLAGIPYDTPRDMLHQMWWKLMVNVGMNQVSAVTGLHYEGVRSNPAVMEQMHRAQREVIDIANALGITMDERDIEAWDKQLDTLCCDGLSSTLQDIRAKRKTEVELYGETICRLGKSLGIETPENRRLAERIREIESEYL
ncbi:MAG: ketopantoate reductase family protein [Clostridia bacterium]|nr:ketopantoate reductase family protein [Clostridia bacterium]MBQ4266474.1 ketopantoate reductase family protein [Clostridia bacterium]